MIVEQDLGKLSQYQPGEYCKDIQCPQYNDGSFDDKCNECEAFAYYQWLKRNGYMLLAVSGRRMNKPDENKILKAVNAVLNLKYEHLADVSDAELRRAYLLLEVEVLLQDHPECRVFICRPRSMPEEPENGMQTECLFCGGSCPRS